MNPLKIIVLALPLFLTAAALHAECIGEEIEALYRAGDIAGLQEQFEQLRKQAGSQEDEVIGYGLAAYRLADLYLAEEEEQPAKKVVNAAVERLEAAWEHTAAPEVGALLSLLYGTQIRISPSKGMFIGGTADKVTQAAVEKAPENPRTALAQGIALLYKPGLFGGGAGKGVPELLWAAALFDGEPQRGKVCWGRDDADIQLAMAQQKLGEAHAATAALERVLARHPEHKPARRLLTRIQAAQERKELEKKMSRWRP